MLAIFAAVAAAAPEKIGLQLARLVMFRRERSRVQLLRQLMQFRLVRLVEIQFFIVAIILCCKNYSGDRYTLKN